MDVNGVCAGADTSECGPGTMLVNNECVPDGSMICETGTVFSPDTGRCVVDPSACASGTVLVDGECRDPADVAADVQECDEPNDGPIGAPCTNVTAPPVGSSTTVSGCITPREDIFGNYQSDLDIFLFEVSEATTLDITVDGWGGLAGAFLMQSLDDELSANDWIRFGLNMTGDMSQRQVFLPKAGTYALAFSDSRSLFLGLPTGDPDGGSCYLATVSAIPNPTPSPITDAATGNMEGTVVAYEYAPSEGAILFNELASASEAAIVDMVVTVNGQYVGNAPLSGRSPTDSAFVNHGGLSNGDTVIFYVDPIYSFALAPPRYDLTIFAPTVVEIPETGGGTTMPEPDDPDTLPYSFGYFDVTNPGDVIRFDFLTDSADGVEFLIVDSRAFIVSAPCPNAAPCTSHANYVQFVNSGRYYFAMFDTSDPRPPSFELTMNRRTSLQPGVLTVNTPLNGQTLDPDLGVNYYRLTPGTLEWWGFTGAPNGFGGEMVGEFYPGNITGELGTEVLDYDSVVLDVGIDAGRIIDDGLPILLAIRDDAPSGAGTFDFAVTERAYTDLGTIDETTPVNNENIDLAANEEQLYLIQGQPAHDMDITVTPVNTEDMVLTLFDSFEERDTNDAGGSSQPEFDSNPLNEAVWTAIGVSEAAGAAGSYNFEAMSVPPPYYHEANNLPYVDCYGQGGATHALIPTGTFPPEDEGVSESPIVLPFSFEFFGAPLPLNEVNVYSNGIVILEGASLINTFGNTTLPNIEPPNSIVAPGWDDLDVVDVCVLEAADRVTIQWTGNKYFSSLVVEMQLVIHSDGHFDFIYGPNNTNDGFSSTVGVENAAADDGYEVARNTAGTTLPGTSYSVFPYMAP